MKILCVLVLFCNLALTRAQEATDSDSQVLQLRALYAKPIAEWPMAETADAVKPIALAPLKIPTKLESPKIALGKQLFNDPILSRDNSVSCASCHLPRLAFVDRRQQAIGIDGQTGRRNTQALFALDQWQSFFWDGRAVSAQAQALVPISDHKEMDLPLNLALERLNTNSNYQKLFKSVYKTPMIDSQQLADAIVAFELTIEPPNTLFQQALQAYQYSPSKAVNMLSEQQLKGLHLFRTKAKCMTCHEGAMFSDNQFHNTGLTYYGRRFEDLGRYEVTGNKEDVGRFRTASLVGLQQTRPWMHNGLFNNLRGIVNLYNAGGARPKPRAHQIDDPLFPVTSNLLDELKLNDEEIADLVAFLETL
ncbi:cytochrome-c peroxidase [Glaciecola sp. 1036]|uniref:cytochrome-c peroxidase n=1 Tax=Alteromonadaceae TaxID=72275 RepID=UPI003CFBD07C